MKIIITAAGLGSRFKEIGIKEEKYEIVVRNKPIFYWSLNSLKNLFNEDFIFIFHKDTYRKEFVEKQLKDLGISKWKLILIDKRTDGQATTALLADSLINEKDDVLIFNIDTYINPDEISLSTFNKDGIIVTTKAKGEHWSFAKTNKNNRVIEVSEKVRISENASVGMYYFKEWRLFKEAYKNSKEEVIKKYKEFYICPMYQYLIDNDYEVFIHNIKLSSLVCLGTPKEVSEFDPFWNK
ncbi:MAG: glycosyltransferase family 2 protein [Mycoplasma sp.]